MASMSYDRHCAEIVAQTALLRTRLDDADLSAPVPTCPGWTLAQLVRHLGGAHRWAETIIRTRAADPVPDDLVNDVSGHPDVDAVTLGAWLTDGAERLADALRAAGPDVPVWTVAPGGTPAFWARRMTHETVVHRADAAFVAARAPGGSTGADRPFAVVEDVAVDALDEWMSFGSLPVVRETTPRIADFMGRGHTLRFQATDAAPEAVADWLIALEADALTWRRPSSSALSPPLARAGAPTALAAPATTTVRGALSDLLLLVYGRIPTRGTAPAPVGAGTGPVEISGDVPLLDAWLHAVSFWLRE
ncbi:maleylpyruvate isomerase N-terminal domain-containing protein [Streptomyces noursei]|uniref:maleylpyruvate isomerase N-terminal domain-containing protein n=1 Tax=Streptomyces noursei TaxID=1971 RepID=UPI00083651B3